MSDESFKRGLNGSNNVISGFNLRRPTKEENADWERGRKIKLARDDAEDRRRKEQKGKKR